MATNTRSRWAGRKADSRAIWSRYRRYDHTALPAPGEGEAAGPLFAGRRHLPIHGPAIFRAAVLRLLDELRRNVPHRHREVLDFFPQAVYAPEIGRRAGFAGRSDGLFALDGTDYPAFRRVFLHEVGHCIGRRSMYDPYTSEAMADAYAERVLLELGH